MMIFNMLYDADAQTRRRLPPDLPLPPSTADERRGKGYHMVVRQTQTGRQRQ